MSIGRGWALNTALAVETFNPDKTDPSDRKSKRDRSWYSNGAYPQRIFIQTEAMRELTAGQWCCEFKGFPWIKLDEYLDKNPRATDEKSRHRHLSVHQSCDFSEAPETRSPICPTPEMPP